MKNNNTRRDFFRKSFLFGELGLATQFKATRSLFANIGEKNGENERVKNCFISGIWDGKNVLHRIVIVGDPHWGDGHISTDHSRLGRYANNIYYTDRFELMINCLNQEKESEGTDFIVFNGDLVTNHPKDLPVVKDQFKKLKAKYYVVHGNHGHSSEENWKNLWEYGRNHSFSIGNYGIIFLNSTDEKGKYECADHFWLENQLNKFKEKKGVIVFCHIFQHDKNFISGGVDCPVVTELMLNAGNNLKMAIYSHTHLMNEYYTIRKDRKQINTFFTGHFSAWGLPYLRYRIIEVYDNRSIGTYAYNYANKEVHNYKVI